MPPTQEGTRRCVQLLVPMGGHGSRFADAGFELPKPLIPVEDGVPMVLKSISSFAPHAVDEYSTADAAEDISLRTIFVVREEHEVRYKLRTRLQQLFASAGIGGGDNVNDGGGKVGEWNDTCGDPDCFSSTAKNILRRLNIVDVQFVMMYGDTHGAVETSLLAEGVLYWDAPVVVMDCDVFFRSYMYEKSLRDMLLVHKTTDGCKMEGSGMTREHPEGLLVYFHSNSPRYSYARLKGDGSGDVLETAEKVPISNCALVGAYGFASGLLFVRAGKALMQNAILMPTNSSETSGSMQLQKKGEGEGGKIFCPLVKEYYLSLLYNYLLDWGCRVRAVPMDEFASFGTPEELARYKSGLPSYIRS